MIILSEYSHSHTGSHSDFSFVERICFFENLNVVLKVTRYDSGKLDYVPYGNAGNFDKAKETYEFWYK